MNKGRTFESEIKNSCKKQNIFCWKIADTYIPAKAISTTVFVPQQPCDFIMASQGFTWFIEAKSTKEKFITFARNKDSKGILQYHQWNALAKFNEYEEVKCGLLVQFENETDSPLTYFWPIDGFLGFYYNSDKKSFNSLDVVQYHGQLVDQTKMRTHFTYDISKILQNNTK